jgi:60 kDa SS-A/Ro ribonucleoprotein
MNDEQAALWKELADNTLKAPEDTWEVHLSAGKDKKQTFTDLLTSGSLGALALLRNLRNMQSAGVDEDLIRSGLATMKIERVLPFRFITAARYAPNLELSLEEAMFRCLNGMPKLQGKTVLLVDHSGSMNSPISNKSELLRFDAACALAMLLREICEDVQVVSFSDRAVNVPPRRGFGLRDAIKQAQGWGGTNIGVAVAHASKLGYDRCIVITDEQSHDQIGAPLAGSQGYVLNVAAYANGVGYGPWMHLDGWSEACIDYILQFEAQE